MTTPRPGRVRIWFRNNRWRWCCACGVNNSSGSERIRRMYRQAATHARRCPAIRAHAAEAEVARLTHLIRKAFSMVDVTRAQGERVTRQAHAVMHVLEEALFCGAEGEL